MMPNNVLDALIGEMEKQQSYLKIVRDSYMKEFALEEAQYYQTALFNTSRELRILYDLREKNFNKISAIKRQLAKIRESDAQGSQIIEIMGKDIEIPINSAFHISMHISRLERQLEELSKNKSNRYQDSDVLAGLLQDLIVKQVSSISCHIKDFEFDLKITKDEDKLVLSCINSNKRKTSWALHKGNIRILRRNIFDVDDVCSFTKNFIIEKSVIDKILIDLGIIFFEIFDLHDTVDWVIEN